MIGPLVGAIALAMAAPSGLGASDAYADAVARYQAVDLEGAEQEMHASLADAATDSERARVHAWLGLIAAQLQRTDDAKRAFSQAVALDRAVRMPAEAAPAVTKLLEDARAQLPPPEPRAALAPTDAPADPTAEDTGPPLTPLMIGGVGGALALAGTIVVGVGLDTALRQAPAAEFNDDAHALVATAYTEYVVGAVLLAMGTAAGVTAATVALVE